MNIFRAFMELDQINESFNDRAVLIAELKALGKNYNFDKYTDAQLYRILEKTRHEANRKPAFNPVDDMQVVNKPKCNTCGVTLTDGGFCPRCDDGVEDYNESLVEETAVDKSLYVCTECGFEIELAENEYDGCCPKCHDHHGGFIKCEEDTTNLFENWSDDKLAELLNKPKKDWTEEDWSDYHYCMNANAEYDYFDSIDEELGVRETELSTQHAVVSVVDQIKYLYEAGLFSKLPVGRDKAFTVDIFGVDKERLVGYFKKCPEFNYELNNESGIISHEFISHEYDIEIFDDFVSMYRIPQNESLKEGPFLTNWVTASGDKYTWSGNTPGTTANSSTTPSVSYVLAGKDNASINDTDFYNIEVDGNWYGEVADVKHLRKDSYYKDKADATKSAIKIIKEINIDYFNIFIYMFDSTNDSLALVDEIKASVILNQANIQSGYVVEIVWDPTAKKLRARADDGVHGQANVAFPNHLRIQGKKYLVDTLTWNGKNYRASGNIVAI